MINFKKTIAMYDKFIDNDELTTKELLELGFNSHDLTKFIEQGQLERVRRGVYTVASADQMLFCSNYFIGKNDKERASKILYRALELFPDDQRINSKVFNDSLFTCDYEQTFKCLDVMMETENKNYMQDQNFWLYLLSIVTEVPDKYKDKVKKMAVNDVYVLPTDKRYEDKKLTNNIRKAVLKFNFNRACELTPETPEYKEKKFASIVTSRLLYLAKNADIKQRKNYTELAKKKDYSSLANKLCDNSEIRKISFNEICALLLANDLISMTQYKKFPHRRTQASSYGEFYNLIYSCDYVNALKNNVRESSYGEIFESLLESSIVEYNKLIAIRNGNKSNGRLEDDFYNVILHLVNNDVDGALKDLDNYLAGIGKSEYKNYVRDLIELDTLNKDTSYFEPILALAKIRNNDCDFSVSIYITEFYLQMYKNDYKKAAIYLDLLSMSSLVEGVDIDVTQMRESLLEWMKQDGLDESDLNSYIDDRKEKNILDEFCCLVDVFKQVTEDRKLVMLAPLSEDDATKVLDISKCIPNVSSIVLDENGTKRIFFRYFDKKERFYSIKDDIAVANQLYKIGSYDKCIDVYEKVLSKISEPKDFIYARLGLAYYKTAQGNDFSSAVNYLTLANANNNNNSDEKYNFDSLINNLKRRSGYDGIKIKLDSIDEGNVISKNMQYKKEN